MFMRVVSRMPPFVMESTTNPESLTGLLAFHAGLGSGGTGLTKLISPFQNSRQNLSSVRALTHSKIFVNKKFQSHHNKHHRFLAVSLRKGYMRSQESPLTASIEYVASAYYCLCSSFFAPLNSFNSKAWFSYAADLPGTWPPAQPGTTLRHM